MPVFTAIAAAVSAALGGGIIGAIGGFIVRAVVTLGISRLATKMLAPDNKNQASTDQGIRLQLEPATDNRVPVVYVSAFIGGWCSLESLVEMFGPMLLEFGLFGTL